MRDFNRGNNRFDGGRDFNRGNNRFGGGRDFSDRPQMHKAICSKCGNDCELPFRPTGAKPVYCSKCFESNRGFEPRRPEGRNTGGRFNDYSENRNDKRNENTGEQFKKQFESLNWKLDKILKMLTPAVPLEVVQEKKIEKEVINLKPKKSTISTKKKKPAVKKEV